MHSEFDFEKALNELEQIVREFESGKLSLEEGLKKFERGLMLAKMCRERLRQVENRIEELKAEFTTMMEEPEEYEQ